MSNASEYAASVGSQYDAAEYGAPFGYAECLECGAEPGEPCAACDACRDALTAADWLSEQLDIVFAADSRGRYLGCEVLVTCGGPHAVIDTRERALIVTWGSDTARHYLPTETVAAIDAEAADLWDLTAGGVA